MHILRTGASVLIVIALAACGDDVSPPDVPFMSHGDASV